MDKTMTLQLTLRSYPDGIHGYLTQFGTLYAVEITKDDGEDFSLDVDNKASGTHEEGVRHAPTLRQAVVEAIELLGELAGDAFPGFESAEES